MMIPISIPDLLLSITGLSPQNITLTYSTNHTPLNRKKILRCFNKKRLCYRWYELNVAGVRMLKFELSFKY